MAKQQIVLNNFFQGGISDSQYVGVQNSLAEIVGLDLHSEPGITKVSQALTKISSTTIDDAVSCIVPCSDGKAYLFGKTTGKIWSLTTGGVLTLEATDGSASPGILFAEEYNGYIYYAAAAKLGKWQVGTAWSTRNDTFATFTNANASYHPMFVKNGVLYIGDGYLVAQVDDSTGSPVFTADALDLPKKYVAQSLGEIDVDLVIGATTASTVVDTEVFRWNTYSSSFTNNDNAPEVGINAFLPLDNVTVVQAGQRGNIYVYNGSQLEQFKRIQGDWSNTNKAFVHGGAVANYLGRALFGLSKNVGSPCNLGVYSFGGFANNYPKVLTLEYVLSTTHLTNIEVTAIALFGDDILVAWKDTNSGTSYGLDKVDWSNKYANAYLRTRVINLDRANGKLFNVALAYRSMPTGCALTLKAAVNNGSFTNVELVQDVDRHLYSAKDALPLANTVRLEVGFTVSGNNAPELESILIDL